MKFTHMWITADYTNLDYKNNAKIITDLIVKSCSSNASLKNPIPNSVVRTKNLKIFRKTVQTQPNTYIAQPLGSSG
jgi:uncharacterized circularly permuted ATP-grasp superfamily protein